MIVAALYSSSVMCLIVPIYIAVRIFLKLNVILSPVLQGTETTSLEEKEYFFMWEIMFLGIITFSEASLKSCSRSPGQ